MEVQSFVIAPIQTHRALGGVRCRRLRRGLSDPFRPANQELAETRVPLNIGSITLALILPAKRMTAHPEADTGN